MTGVGRLLAEVHASPVASLEVFIFAFWVIAALTTAFLTLLPYLKQLCVHCNDGKRLICRFFGLRSLVAGTLAILLFPPASSALAQTAREAGPVGPEPAGDAGERREIDLSLVIDAQPDELDPALEPAIRATSGLEALARDGEAAGPVDLVGRLVAEPERIATALRAFGRYAGRIEVSAVGIEIDAESRAAPLIDRIEALAAGSPVPVAVRVTPGPIYTIARIDMDRAEDAPPTLSAAEALLSFRLRPGEPARSAPILAAEQEMVRDLRAGGLPFVDIAERTAVIDHDTRSMELAYVIDPGPRPAVGRLIVEGTEAVSPALVTALSTIRPGDRFDPVALAAYRDRLAELDIFQAIDVLPADDLDPDGTLPIRVRVTERLPRYIGFSADFSTDEGLGAGAFWGHRSLFGFGETLEISARLRQGSSGGISDVASVATDDIGGQLGTDFRKPAFLRLDQALTARSAVLRERTDGFDRDAVEAAAGIERRFGPRLTGEAEVEVQLVDIAEAPNPEDTGRFATFALPASLAFDSSDDLLRPTKGFRARLALTPTPFVLGDAEPFLLARGSLIAYRSLDDRDRLIVAARIGLGASAASETSAIPANKRFFAGGGGSVRGFAFQEAGPIDADGDPIGGRSLVEGSVELRWAVTETIGVVPFVDAGNAFDAAFPDFEDGVRIGAGLGLRYYSPVGPLRADIAVPVNRRDTDDAFQFYLSIGEAF